jgi:hypothetical protein
MLQVFAWPDDKNESIWWNMTVHRCFHQSLLFLF